MSSPTSTAFSPQLPSEDPSFSPFQLNDFPYPSWEYLSWKHKIPPTLQEMNELDKMGVAYAYEARDVVEHELYVAEKRFIQQLIVARTFQLRLIKAKDRLHQINHSLSLMVNVAENDVSSKENPNLRISQNGKNLFRLASFN
jgi:hypothetical protein